MSTKTTMGNPAGAYWLSPSTGQPVDLRDYLCEGVRQSEDLDLSSMLHGVLHSSVGGTPEGRRGLTLLERAHEWLAEAVHRGRDLGHRDEGCGKGGKKLPSWWKSEAA